MLEQIDLLLDRAKSLKAREKEIQFLESIRQQHIIKGSLSPAQLDWFSSMEKKYSEKNVEEEKNWESSFSSHHRDIAKKVANYYAANPPYFHTYVSKILGDSEDFVLSKREWDKFCENKYAKKIRKEYESPPKFCKSQCVQIRRTNKVIQANYSSNKLSDFMVWGNLADKFGFILAVDARPITRAARGSRVYQVLLFGHSKPIFAHESDLKKARRSKIAK